MTTNGTSATETGESFAGAVDDGVRSLLDRGRSVADHLPDAVDDARSAIDAAQAQLDQLSDRGVIAAVGFTAGITAGLFLGGASRLILAVSILPLAFTMRTAMTRGVRLSRLVN